VLAFEGERTIVDTVAISPDGRYLLASAGGVRLWSLTNPHADPIELTGGHAIGFLPDGRLVVAGSVVLVAHPDAPHKGAVRFPAQEPVTAVLPDGRLLALIRPMLLLPGSGSPPRTGLSNSNLTEGELVLASIQPGGAREEARLPLPRTTLTAAVSPDGRRVAVAVELPAVRGRMRSAVRLLALTDGEQVGELAPSTGSLRSVTWSPDGRYIAGVLGAKLVVWSAEDGKTRGELEAGGTRLFCGPRFHPSGRFLAAGGANLDGGVYCWNVGTWEELVGYRWPVGPVVCVNFSPDGTLAVVGGERGRILVWDVD
jgi:WD40 repeat protein